MIEQIKSGSSSTRRRQFGRREQNAKKGRRRKSMFAHARTWSSGENQVIIYFIIDNDTHSTHTHTADLL